ncbi:MAG: protein kinase [Gemmatimonadota bacterium]|jgi:serine/threonine-protein kinase
MSDTLPRLNAALKDRYRVERQIGAGGMATVFLAEDLRHRRSVALKVLRPELAASLGSDRFLTEIEVTANLQHPGILPLHDSGEADGLLYFVMPYVRGESLRERLDQEGPLPVMDVVRILRDVADALAYAHEQGIVHRDIKPSNVLMSGRGHVVVSDFGIAKAVSGARGPSTLTSAGITLGTLAYMAPEQVSGEPTVDARADVYSLGAMGYELLSGRLPFQGDSPRAVLAAQLTQTPEPIGKLRPDVPPPLADAIMRCLEKDPSDRWQRAEDVLHALAPLGTGGRHGAGTPARTTGAPRRRTLWAAAGAVLVVAAAVGGWFALGRGGGGAADQPRIVAVVPLATIGGDASTQAFASGLVEVLASRLTELTRFATVPMWVIPPNEVRELQITSAAQARKELNATLAVTGSLQALADGVRLTLNLVDAETLRQLRSTVLSGPLTDLATWQDGAVEQALGMLDVQPGEDWSAAPEGGTGVGTAYELYVQARGYLQRTTGVEAAIDTATALFNQALAEDSSYALAWAGLGEADWNKYRQTLDTQYVARAIASSQRALALSDSLPQVWTTLAIIDNGMGRSEDALANAGRALEIDSLYTEAYLELATAHRDLQQFDQAEEVLQGLVDRRPYYWKGYADFAFLRYVQGRYPEAADLYHRAGELAPGNPNLTRNAGAIYFFLDRWKEAREMLLRSIEAEPGPGAVSNVGTLDYFEGDFQAAAERYRQAIALRERDYVYWRNLGDAYRQIPGRDADARAAYEKSLALAQDELRVNPSDNVVLQNVAFVEAALGHDDDALAIVDRLEPNTGDDADQMVSLAQTLEEVGQRDRALGWITKALDQGYSRRIIESEPQLAGLRSDPRFQAALAAAGDSGQAAR